MRSMLMLVCLLSGLSQIQGQISFQGAVDQLVNHRDLKGADISVSVIDVRGNQLLGAHREKDLLIPASSLKVLTTSSSLLLFGSNYRFRTRLKYSGYIDVDGVLHGDIYIVGGGDPCLASDQISAAMDLDPLLEFFFRSVKKAGIKRITGNIIGDSRFLQGDPTPPDWHKSDVGNYYGAGAWGLNVHENYFYLPFQQTTTIGATPTMKETDPQIPGLTLDNQVKSAGAQTDDNAYIYGGAYEFDRYVTGTIPSGSGTFTIKGSIPNPPLLLAQLLKDRLENRKIQVDGEGTFITKPHEGVTISQLGNLFTLSSPPLELIIQRANLESVNVICEVLLKDIGKEELGKGTRSSGVAALQRLWKTRGVNLGNITMVDGSGLSRSNRISSYQLAQVIRKTVLDPRAGEAFIKSLPVAGQSGTLEKRMNGTVAEGRVKAKTGSMRGVQSISGLVEQADGSYIAFSVLVNDYSSSAKTRAAIDRFLVNLCQ